MIKAVFLDYTGTIVQEGGEDLEELIRRVTASSNFASPQEAVQWWFSTLADMESHAYQDTFVSEQELSLRVLEKAAREKGLKEDLLQLQQLNMNFWMYAPMFSDAQLFFDQCPLPIYIVSNNAPEHIRICLHRNNLHVNGIISASEVRAYKPRRELFAKALEKAGVSGPEAVMIGDSFLDMEGAQTVDMVPVLLDRHRSQKDAPYRTIHSLQEALRLL